MADIRDLSDADLRAELMDYGVNAAITMTTRAFFEKKLGNLRNQEPRASPGRRWEEVPEDDEEEEEEEEVDSAPVHARQVPPARFSPAGDPGLRHRPPVAATQRATPTPRQSVRPSREEAEAKGGKSWLLYIVVLGLALFLFFVYWNMETSGSSSKLPRVTNM